VRILHFYNINKIIKKIMKKITPLCILTINITTGKISGTFTETRAVYPNARPTYTPGTTTGEFNFDRK